MRRCWLIGWTLALALGTWPAVCCGQVGKETPTGEQLHLGRVNFPTGCSSDAQPLIEKGVALLHSFQYQEAQQTFADAESRDGKCDMAILGKAM